MRRRSPAGWLAALATFAAVLALLTPASGPRGIAHASAEAVAPLAAAAALQPAAATPQPATATLQPAAATPQPAAATPPHPSQPPPSPLSPPAHGYVEYQLPEAAGSVGDPFLPKVADVAAAGINPAALTHLILRANLLHSDALVVVKDGRLVVDQRFTPPVAPIESSSITKSVSALAIGRLLYTARIRSLDQPVSTWFPDWKNAPGMTLRMIMNHTSGLAAAADTAAIDDSPDVVRLALEAPLASPPGSRFFYNNKAVNLLAAVVERASGRKLDEYVRDEIFAPLGITHFSWTRDAAGNPTVYSGLAIDARDLARIGELMLDAGVNNTMRLVGADFIAAAVAPAQPYTPTSGLLWWQIPAWTRITIEPSLLDAWRHGGVDPRVIAALAPLAGQTIPRETLFTTLERAVGPTQAINLWVHGVVETGQPTPKTTVGPPVGFDANGSLGQYLVVLPASRLIAVRQIRRTSLQAVGDDFEDFPDMVRALVAPPVPTAPPAPTPPATPPPAATTPPHTPSH